MKTDNRTVLFHEGNISVTRSWISLGVSQYAIRNVNKLSSETHEPPKGAALGALFVCLFLAILTVVRVVWGDFSIGLGRWIVVACAVVMLWAGHVAFVRDGTYRITVTFDDGESVTILMPTASASDRFQKAVRDALDQLDYHDTDQASPTVVLASLEPTNLKHVSGPEPKVVRVADDEAKSEL